MIKFMTLSEVCTNIVDCPHESPEWLKEGIPVIRNFNLVDGQIDLSDDYYVDEETYKKRIRRAVPGEGDIIFSREAPIGNCAIIPHGFKCCLGQRLVLLRVNKDICSPEYLLTVLLSDYVKKQIEQVSRRGSIVSNFNISDLGELSIPIIDNQEEVSSFATMLSKKITNNKLINAELESMAKTIYDYWFLQFDFPDENGKPYKSSGGKMVWNEELKREIPEGWEVKKIGDVAELYQPQTIGEKDFVSDGAYNVYGANGIVGKYNKYNHVNNEIAICCRGASCGRFLMTQPYSWITGNAMVVAPKEQYGKEYIYYGLSYEIISPFITGSAQPQITRANLENMLIVIPDDEIVKLFEESALERRKYMQNIFRENQELASLRDFLLPLLMNGQVGFKN